jgi:hypothetical protein
VFKLSFYSLGFFENLVSTYQKTTIITVVMHDDMGCLCDVMSTYAYWRGNAAFFVGFYLPHMEYEGLVTGKMKKNYC